MRRLVYIGLLILVGWSGAGLSRSNPQIIVYADSIILQRAHNPIGINLNYLRDSDALREEGSIGLGTALKALGVRWLRYPGGKKSNYHRFALPPYRAVDVQTSGRLYLANRANDVLDFDEYLALLAETEAKAFVVVAYDRERITDGTTTLEEYIDHAVGWVRYARQKGNRVVYWEIGNENWNNFDGSEWAEVVCDIKLIAQAMKTVDNTIKVGANFSNESQLKELLGVAKDILDFVSYSNYYPGTAWSDQGFSVYERQDGLELVFLYGVFDRVKKAHQRDDLELIISECNAKDWTGIWSDSNDIAHALVCLELCAQLNQREAVTAGMFWNTSWFDQGPIAFNLLTARNGLRANALAISAWNRFWKPCVLAAQGAEGLMAYAMRGLQHEMSVFVVNRTAHPKEANLVIVSGSEFVYRDYFLLSGDHGGPGDTTVTLKEINRLPVFPAYSVTVINLH